VTQTIDGLAASVRERFEPLGARVLLGNGQATLEIDAPALLEVCRALRDEPRFAFGQLVDLCGIDYLGFGEVDWETSETATSTGFSRGVGRSERAGAASGAGSGRFAVVYHLLSHANNARLRLRCRAPGEPPRVASVVDLWASADWYEREAFDLYGILFEGHPDLRRILTDYGFIGHPFRKDFPLSGEVEMRYDTERARVVYEPVTIEPRTLVPRVIRHDGRPAPDQGEPADA
jgi:NADH-quinone oxidoreductase subunit C